MVFENKHINSIISGLTIIFLKNYRQYMTAEGRRISLEQEQTP